jgi:prepilin-type N-terminal cleavage/methylation domain-containing protein
MWPQPLHGLHGYNKLRFFVVNPWWCVAHQGLAFTGYGEWGFFMRLSAKSQAGFTLAELLIALAILGVIATFTIPKILTATGTSQLKAVAKESASILSGAYQDFDTNYSVTSTTGPTTTGFLANVNYVAVVTGAPATSALTGLPTNCVTGTNTCLQLHNGAILQYRDANNFGGTASTNYIHFNIDPDGTKGTATTDIVTFKLYANGKITDTSNGTGTTASGGTAGTDYVATTPSWFTWVQ